MRRIFLAAVLSCALSATFSSTAVAAEGGVTSTINRLYYYQGHTGLLVIVNSMADLGGCGNASWFILPTNHVYYKENVALLMSAQAQNAQISLTVSDCHEGYGRIKHVMLIS